MSPGRQATTPNGTRFEYLTTLQCTMWEEHHLYVLVSSAHLNMQSLLPPTSTITLNVFSYTLHHIEARIMETVIHPCRCIPGVEVHRVRNCRTRQPVSLGELNIGSPD
jgi:hypothetical protein